MYCKPFFALAAVLAASTLPLLADPADDISSAIRNGIQERVYPGAVLVAHVPGKLDIREAFGRHTYSPDSPPMTLDTIFDLASVSKVAGTTAAALLALQDGRIRLSDPVSGYLPAFAANGKSSVTIRHLLTHTSGLKPYVNAAALDASRPAEQSKADFLIDHYCSLTPQYVPGSDLVYSCLNMQTMARVVETAEGQSLQSLLSRRMWQPLGMPDTGYILSGSQKARSAPTSERADGTPVRGVIHDPIANYYGAGQHCPGNAGLFSTAPDLARYCQMMIAGGELDGVRVLKRWVVDAASVDQTPRTIDSRRGLGWILGGGDRLSGKPPSELMHSGYTGTYVWMDRSSGAYFVLLTNRVYPTEGKEGSASALSAINRQIAEHLRRLAD